MRRYCALLFLMAALLTEGTAAPSIHAESTARHSAAAVFRPNILPSLNVRPATTPVVVDGKVNEPAWHFAAVARNFSEVYPGDQAEPPITVAAFMTYDKDNLYVAFTVEDDPEHIRANLSDRDALWQDDYVGVVLDPNQDGQSLYFIASNPLGIQGDSRISPNNEDEGFNLIYTSEATVSATGYAVEMAIPFKSLRFPNQHEQVWRGTFWVTHPRESRNQYSWAAMDRDNPCWACQMGTITGIQGVQAGRNLEILPALTGGKSSVLENRQSPAAGFDHGRIALEPSLTAKYGITSNVTADVTVNPDFSQIESDAARIDVNSTFALFYDERRPFFQEGSDLFDTEIRTVYTRTINDPIVASKLTARWGSTDIAYIGARDNTSPLLMPFEDGSVQLDAGKSVSNILRIKHNFAGNSYVGALVTDRRLDSGGTGSTVGADGQLRFFSKYLLTGQLVASRTAESSGGYRGNIPDNLNFGRNDRYSAELDGQRFGGLAAAVELDREGRYWGFEVGYKQTSPTFRAANGFVRQNSVRRVYAWQGVTLYPEKVVPFIERIRPGIAAGRRWNYFGQHKNDFLSPSVRVRMKGQTNVNARYTLEREQFKGKEFRGIRSLRLSAYSNFSEYASLSAEMSAGTDIARTEGEPKLGRSLDLSASVSLRPNQHLALQPMVAYSHMKDRNTGESIFSGYIARMRVKYQFSRRFFFRTVVQYNDFRRRINIDPLLTYRLNAFTAVYLGATHQMNQFSRVSDPASRYFHESSRQIFFKLQYLVRT